MTRIAIVDYGMGNLHSVLKKLRRIGADPCVASTHSEIQSAEKLVLPGVGHFGRAMQNLEASGLRSALEDAVRTRGIPILGICLGMQLFARVSEEGDAKGLGWLDAEAVRFQIRDPVRFKVPQMGWNTVSWRRANDLARGLPAESDFYFAHAYHLSCRNPDNILGETEYSYCFPSAVQNQNIFGVQFHPEKSHDLGEAVLRNFMAL